MNTGPSGPAGTGETPPRVAQWLVSFVLPRAGRDVVLGDLLERFRDRAAQRGVGAARRWYWRQAVSFVARVPASRAAAGLNGVMAGDTVAARFGPVATGIGSELRFAFRSLRRRRGLSMAAVAVLALAIGASTTVFSVVKAILIERIPFQDPDRLVMIWDRYPEHPDRDAPIRLDHYREWMGRTDLFTSVGAYETTSPSLEYGEWPERVEGAFVTSNLLPLLGARPALGRLLAPEDEAEGAAPVIVLSHGLWQSRFGGDPSIVGRQIRLGGVDTRVVGVMSEAFWFYDPYMVSRSLTGWSGEAARLWLPLRAGAFGGETDYPRYRVIARLRDGVSLPTAADAAAAARSRMTGEDAQEQMTVELLPLSEQIRADSRPRLLGLFGAVALVLLIACVNLVNLLLVHVESRRSEFAVRAALGAGRGRLALQPVLESVLLAAGGGVVGLALARLGTGWLVGLVPRGLPLAHRIGIDVAVAAFGIGLALLAGLAVGVMAALRIDLRRIGAVMLSGSRTVSGSRSSRRIHGALVAAEVSLSLVLFISATLLLRSLASLHGADTGFEADGVLTFHSTLAVSQDRPANTEFFPRLEAAVREMPGVEAVGSTSALPFSLWGQLGRIEIDGTPVDGSIERRVVSPGYFDAIRLPLRSGRVFSESDRGGAPPVVVVNEAAVDRWLGGDSDPIGRTITVIVRDERTVHTVVGVVANVKHERLDEADRPILYSAHRQWTLIFQRFAVRVAAGDPMRLVEPVRRAAAAIDPAQPLQDFISFDALVARSFEEESFYTKILGAFAAAAILLTLVGIYGVVAYITRQRDREVGIRMALGAGAGSVRRLVLGQGLIPVAIGLGLGWLGGLATAGLLRGLLHGIAERDPRTFALAAIMFAIAAAAACLIPANRAARVEPATVLRSE
jgi:predicted permease